MTAKQARNRATSPATAPTAPEGPITLTLPWAVLVRDNARHGLMRGRIVLTARYREALEAAKLVVAASLLVQTARPGGFYSLTGPVALTATFHEPDRSRSRDVTNYAKLLCDALAGGGAIKDDSQIDDARYVRGPVDKANPRVDIVLAALRAPTPAPVTAEGHEVSEGRGR